MDSLQNLKSRLHGGDTSHAFDDEEVVSIHDTFMCEYGWIPLEEFKKIPIPTMWGLVGYIRDRREAERKEYNKSKNRGKR